MLLSQGLINKWIKDLVTNSSNCDTVSKMMNSHSSLGEPRHFSLEEMASFFFLILIGHFIASLGFGLEAIKKKCCQNGQNVIIVHPCPLETGKFATQGPNIMLPMRAEGIQQAWTRVFTVLDRDRSNKP